MFKKILYQFSKFVEINMQLPQSSHHNHIFTDPVHWLFGVNESIMHSDFFDFTHETRKKKS